MSGLPVVLIGLVAVILALAILVASLGASLRDAQEQIKWLQHRLEELQNERTVERHGNGLALPLILVVFAAALLILLSPQFSSAPGP